MKRPWPLKNVAILGIVIGSSGVIANDLQIGAAIEWGRLLGAAFGYALVFTGIAAIRNRFTRFDDA